MRFEVDISKLSTYRDVDEVPYYCIQKVRDYSYIQVYLDISLPFVLGFTPDIEHIRWVKRAWGLLEPVKPKPPYPLVVDCDGADFDPIPF